MSNQFAFGPKEDDAIFRQRLLTRVTVTRGEPPMRRLVKKLMALSAEVTKDGPEAEAGEDDEEGPKGASGGEGREDTDRAAEAEAEGEGVAGRDPSARSAEAKGQAEKAQAEKGLVECERAAKSFLLELAAFEQPLLKTRAVIGANRRDQQRFREMHSELAQQIDSAQDEILVLKRQLDEARAHRWQEEECELVRHQIAQHPPRGESEAAIAALQRDLEGLERENVHAARVLELRRKQFSLLLHTVDDLQASLEENVDEDLLRAGPGATSSSAVAIRGRGGADNAHQDAAASAMQIDG